MFRAHLRAVLCLIVLTGCSKSAPPPPVVDPPGTIEQLTGAERLGWDQTAADVNELATFSYAIYVDGVRSEANGVSCTPSSTSTIFVCSAKLPGMNPGDHTLEIAAFLVDGSTLESPKSGTLRVRVVTAIPASTSPPVAWPAGLTVKTADGASLELELVANGLDHPTDMALAADGRIFITERAGRVRVVNGGRLLEEPALALGAEDTLVAVALDPDFERTHLLYTIGVGRGSGGRPAFWIARFREAANTLAERAVLLDDIPASAAAAASLRFGPDGKLYAALDNGGDERAGGDLAAFGGKVLRLNADGTTPADQAATTPVFAYAFQAPRGIDWDPASRTMWVADRSADGTSRLNPVTASTAGAKIRGTIRGAYALPATARPSSMAFSRGRMNRLAGSLLVASEEGQRLLRLRIDPGNPTRLSSTESLLEGSVGGIRVVSFGPDGSVYFCTATAVGRLVPTAGGSKDPPLRIVR